MIASYYLVSPCAWSENVLGTSDQSPTSLFTFFVNTIFCSARVCWNAGNGLSALRLLEPTVHLLELQICNDLLEAVPMGNIQNQAYLLKFIDEFSSWMAASSLPLTSSCHLVISCSDLRWDTFAFTIIFCRCLSRKSDWFLCLPLVESMDGLGDELADLEEIWSASAKGHTPHASPLTSLEPFRKRTEFNGQFPTRCALFD